MIGLTTCKCMVMKAIDAYTSSGGQVTFKKELVTVTSYFAKKVT